MRTTEIRVQRPDGTIETTARAGWIDRAVREQMRQATRAAGRGEILDFTERDGSHSAKGDGHSAPCRHCGGYCEGDCVAHGAGR